MYAWSRSTAWAWEASSASRAFWVYFSAFIGFLLYFYGPSRGTVRFFPVFAAAFSAALMCKESGGRSLSKGVRLDPVRYRIVRMSENPVISKISITVSLAPVICICPCFIIRFCALSSTRRPADEM